MFTPIRKILICLSLMALPQMKAQSRVDNAARHCLSDFAKGDFEHLLVDANSKGDFETRLFASYLLFKKAPATYRKIFIKAIPAGPAQFEAFSLIPNRLVRAQNAQTYEVKNPSVPWPISFWEIYNAIFEQAVAGYPRAIKAIFGLSDYGDGEIGEGLGETWLLFYHPDVVAVHWKLFEPHVADLGAVRSESSDEDLASLKAKYARAFKQNPKALEAINYHLDHGTR